MSRDEVMVTIPPVRPFAHVETSKAQALKPLEEAAEVFGAWQRLDGLSGYLTEDGVEAYVSSVVDECCDVITATCNLLAALGVDDLTEAMADCERRNEERGRYADR